ncbi:MAG TPA: hypothetical protein VEA69_10545 [Tepidisphaeraceae bacterium]|nr:hypothetical protein [Tepidisphaeraceae bacterium]
MHLDPREGAGPRELVPVGEAARVEHPADAADRLVDVGGRVPLGGQRLAEADREQLAARALLPVEVRCERPGDGQAAGVDQSGVDEPGAQVARRVVDPAGEVVVERAVAAAGRGQPLELQADRVGGLAVVGHRPPPGDPLVVAELDVPVRRVAGLARLPILVRLAENSHRSPLCCVARRPGRASAIIHAAL